MSRLSTRVGVRSVLSTGEASMLPLIGGFGGKSRKAVSRLFTQAGLRGAWTEQGRGGAGREAARKSTAVERRPVASAGGVASNGGGKEARAGACSSVVVVTSSTVVPTPLPLLLEVVGRVKYSAVASCVRTR
jgi:hypothetical protein